MLFGQNIFHDFQNNFQFCFKLSIFFSYLAEMNHLQFCIVTDCAINVFKKLGTEDDRMYRSMHKHNALANSCLCVEVYNGMEVLVFFSGLWVGVELSPE